MANVQNISIDGTSYACRDSTKASKSEAIKSITRSGTTFTATRCDDTTFTFTQQDNNTTYNVVNKTANGLCPQLPNETTTTKYLRQDGSWAVPPDNNTTTGTTYTAGNVPANTTFGTNGSIKNAYDGLNSSKAPKSEAIKSITRSGTTFTATRCDDTTFTFTQQDNNTTYGVVSKTANGLCPQLPNETTTTKYLRQDGTWVVPPNTTYGTVSKTANGLCPQLPNETTTTKYLRQDGSWAVPPDNNTTTGTTYTAGNAPANKTFGTNGSIKNAYDGLNSSKAPKSEAIKSITRSGTTFTATRCDDTTFTFTQQDNNTTTGTTYNAGSVPANTTFGTNGSIKNVYDSLNSSKANASKSTFTCTWNSKVNATDGMALKLGDLHIITVSVGLGATISTTTTIGTIPSGERPTGRASASVTSTSGLTGYVQVTTDGNINLTPVGGSWVSGNYVLFTLVY